MPHASVASDRSPPFAAALAQLAAGDVETTWVFDQEANHRTLSRSII
jgi:hypothetical protein